MGNLSNNSLAFIALCNEFCAAIEHSAESTSEDLTKEMLRLLPRIYITATDLEAEDDENVYIDSYLDEEKYESIRRIIESIYGEADTFLEVFEEDMKYSDTPIASSVSEGLSDLFQVFYNFVETVKNLPSESIQGAITAMKEDFENYWSQKLCNLLRPLNSIRYHYSFDF